MNTWDIVNIFVVLFLLLGVMYALLYLMKRFLYPSSSKLNKKINVDVLSTQVLMPKKFISIVKIKEKIYLLGVSEQSINLIDKIDDDGTFLMEESNSSVMNNNFLDVLKKSMGK